MADSQCDLVPANYENRSVYPSLMTFGVDSSHLIEHMVKQSTCFESHFLATESATERFLIQWPFNKMLRKRSPCKSRCNVLTEVAILFKKGKRT